MKKLFMILVISVIVLSGCTNKEDKSLTIGLMPGSSQMPIEYAIATDMYKNKGYDVKVEYFKSAQDRQAAFTSGKVDLISGELTSLFNLLNQNIDVKAIGGAASTFKLVANADKFKTIGISENTSIEYYADYYMDLYNKQINKKAIPSMSDRLSSLLSDSIDSAIMPEPYATTAVEGGSKVIWSTNQEGVPQIGLYIFDSSIDDSILKDFYTITNEAIDKMNEVGPSEYKDIIIKSGIVEESSFDAITKEEIPNFITPDKDTWKLLNDWSKEKGIVTKDYNYSDYMVSNV
ncbi:MAG: ABC transporter substrate-binding protein [Mycoplasmatales bacterium]